jgi:preprotein translocase subunit YajC
MRMFASVICLLLSSATLFAENQPDVLPPPDQGFMQTLVMISIALLAFYFILWRPEQKRRKAQEAQRSALKKGDRVTAMGIVGTVSRIQEHTVILKMVDGGEIEFLKAAISEIMPQGEPEAKK